MTKGLFDTVRFDPPELPEPDGLTEHEVSALKALLRVKDEPLIEITKTSLGLEVTNIYDHGAPVWARLHKKGFVLWAGDHWRLLDENATRRALAVEVLGGPTEFRREPRPPLLAPGVPIGLKISQDFGRKIRRGP